MAAEKLTRARLIQIIIMMVVLVSAFIWRTLDYTSESETAVPKSEAQTEQPQCQVQDEESCATSS